MFNERNRTMAEKIIEVEAESLEEAREQVKSKIPKGLLIFREGHLGWKAKNCKSHRRLDRGSFCESAR
jgi:hypothetical protein